MYNRYDFIVVQNIAGKNYFRCISLNKFHIKHLVTVLDASDG
jgi:hypothetical protein